MNLESDGADILQEKSLPNLEKVTKIHTRIIMDDKDRRKMELNCDKLVAEINWPEIWPKLINHGIYRQGRDVQRWKDDLNNATTHKEIYLKIRKRGPEAFEKFLRCLREIDRNDLANILKPENSTDQIDRDIIDHLIPEVNGNNNLEMNNEAVEEETVDDYYTRLQTTNEPLKIVVKKSDKYMECSSGVLCYPMHSNPRGLVLIINNIIFHGAEGERSAAQHDEKNFQDLFHQMGFKVETYRNLTQSAMLNRLEAFSKKPELRHVHSVFVIIMSHGNEHVEDNRSQSVVCGVDGPFITDSQIWDYFNNDNCQDLFNIPKIFIFQTCRGERDQKAVMAINRSLGRDAADTNVFVQPPEPPRQDKIRTYSDMLVAYSTLPGHKAHRDTHTGSWYIQTLCEVIMNHAHNTELTRMLQMADQRLSVMQTGNNGCQTSTFTNLGFNKKCYLNPGYFGD